MDKQVRLFQHLDGEKMGKLTKLIAVDDINWEKGSNKFFFEDGTSYFGEFIAPIGISPDAKNLSHYVMAEVASAKDLWKVRSIQTGNKTKIIKDHKTGKPMEIGSPIGVYENENSHNGVIKIPPTLSHIPDVDNEYSEYLASEDTRIAHFVDYGEWLSEGITTQAGDKVVQSGQEEIEHENMVQSSQHDNIFDASEDYVQKIQECENAIKLHNQGIENIVYELNTLHCKIDPIVNDDIIKFILDKYQESRTTVIKTKNDVPSFIVGMYENATKKSCEAQMNVSLELPEKEFVKTIKNNFPSEVFNAFIDEAIKRIDVDDLKVQLGEMLRTMYDEE